MKILLEEKFLSAMDLHHLLEPETLLRQTDQHARQTIFESGRNDIEAFAQNYSFDCAVLQITPDENFDALARRVRALRDLLPVALLDYGADLPQEFWSCAQGARYPLDYKNMRADGAKESLPEFLAVMSGSYHGHHDPIVDLGNDYRLDRAGRNVFDPQRKIVQMRPTAFRVLEYLALRAEQPVLMRNAADYVFVDPKDRVDNLQDNLRVQIHSLRKALAAHPSLNVLGNKQGLPVKFACFSQHKHFDDLCHAQIARLDRQYHDWTDFIFEDGDDQVLRVGGFCFHSAYPMFYVEGEVRNLTYQEWNGMKSVMKKFASGGLTKLDLARDIREHSKADEYKENSVLEYAIVSNILRKMGAHYSAIISKERKGRGVEAVYKIDLVECAAVQERYALRQMISGPIQCCYGTDAHPVPA